MFESLKKLMAENQITAPLEANTLKATRGGSTWAILKTWEVGDKKFAAATVGDFKTGKKFHWKSEGAYSKAEEAQAKAYLDEIIAKEAEAVVVEQERLAPELQQEFNTFDLAVEHGYFRKKGISPIRAARIKLNPHGDPILAIPLFDETGKFWNFQRIYAQKLSHGDKFFAESARIEGCFFAFTGDGKLPLRAPVELYLCEGVATGASVHEALPEALVVSAFNAQNLHPVAVTLKKLWPEVKIIVCCDDDKYTMIRGKQVNVGLEKGRRAAGAVGGEIRFPVFKYPKEGLTDFNDLQAAEGLPMVKDQLENPGKYVKGIQPMLLRETRGGKSVEPTELELANYLLKQFEGRLVKQDRDLFLFNGQFWEELKEEGQDRLRQWISVAANGLLGSRDIAAYYKTLVTWIPHVPKHVNMYQPNPFCANFQDGTLHWDQEPGGKARLEFKAHDRLDYLTSVLPFPYPGEEAIKNPPPAPEFEAMIDRLWDAKDSEKAKLLTLQIMGSMLMPVYPLIVFFHGKTGSGKSTLIKLFIKIIGYQNTSNVEPAKWHGFNMESMIGKLVNYDTDIDTTRPLQDSELKKMIDRVPRSVRRKFQTDAKAFLPAVHLFAANDLPKTQEKSAGALGRRLVFIKTEKFSAPENFNYDFEQKILSEEMPGLIARAVSGLRSLIETNGHYVRIETDQGTVQKMVLENDVVAQFLAEVEMREVRDQNDFLILDPDSRMPRKNLWSAFDNWQKDAVANSNRIGKHYFFDRIEKRGFETVKIHGEMTVKGLGPVAQKDLVV